MKKFEDNGFTTIVTNDKLKIEIPLSNLVCAFENSPDNYDGSTVKRGKRKQFAEFIAQHILDECDSEDGSTYVTKAIDGVFELIIEGHEDGRDFIKFGEEF